MRRYLRAVRLGRTVADIRIPAFILTVLALAAPARGQTFPVTGAGGPMDLGTQPVGQVVLPLSGAGGTAPYQFSVVSGELPPGVVLRTDLADMLPPGASAAAAGVATTAGNYSFRLEVRDAASQAVDYDCTLKITSFGIDEDWQLPDAFVGVGYSKPLHANGAASGSTLTWAPSGTMPSGLTLSSDGVLSGTPEAAGVFQVPLSVTDGTDTLWWSLTLHVYAIRITTDPLLPNAAVNVPYSHALAVSGCSGGCTLTWSGEIPPGLSLTAGTITGTPTQVGRWNFFVTASDGFNEPYARYMGVTVLPPAPQLPSISIYGHDDRLNDCTVGTVCGDAFGMFTAGSAPPYTWTASGLPDGMELRFGSAAQSNWLRPGDAEIQGRPLTAGVFPITVTVTDADGNSATNAMPLRVSTLGQWNYLQNGTLGVPYLQTLHVLGGTGSYTAAITSGALPLGIAIDPGSFTVSGTPAESGNFSLYLTFASGPDVFTRENGLWIMGAGDPAANLQINTDGALPDATLNQPYSYQLSACCTSGGVTWSVESGSTLPAGLSLTADGMLNGTPTASGVFTFAVRASGAANYAVRQLTLNVSPVFSTDGGRVPYGNVGVYYSYQMHASGGSGSYSWQLVRGMLPPGITIAWNGAIQGMPTATGEFDFTIGITDTVTGNTAHAYVALSIYAAGQHPPMSIPMGSDFGTYSIGEVQFGLTAQNGTGIYTWSLVDGSLPPGLSLRTDGAPWFQPDQTAGLIGVATTPGTYSFTLRVTDGSTSADLPATMTIVALTLKDWNLPAGFQGMDYSYTLTPLNNVGPVTWSSTIGIPPGLALNGSTGEISGQPTAPGYYNIQLLETADGVTVWHNVNLPVYAIHVSTSTPLAGGVNGELVSATPGQPYFATITATGGAGGYQFTSNWMPQGLVLNRDTGVISGTMDPNWKGVYSIWISVTDADGVLATRTFTIHSVASPPMLPTLNAGWWDDCTLGMSCTRTMSSWSGAAAPFTWSATGLPPGMSLRVDGASDWASPGNAELWGTPTAVGTFDVTITLRDFTGAEVTNTFPLHVSELELTNWPVGGTYGTSYSHRLRVIGGTSAYSAAIFAPGPNNRLPVGLALDQTPDGTTSWIHGTPLESGGFTTDLQFVDSAAPQHTLHLHPGVYIAAPGIATIQINTGSDLGTYSTGSTPTMTLSACCVPSYAWSIIGGALPAGWSLNPSTGLLSGGSLATGTYTFVAQVQNANDPTNFAVRQFTMVVTPLSVTMNTNLPYGNVGTYYAQALQVSGASGPVTWSVAPYQYLPPGFSVAYNGSLGRWELAGTPTTTGQFSFSLTVTDSTSQPRTTYFSIAIYPPGGAPPLEFPTSDFGTYPVGMITIAFNNTTGGVPPYHYSLTPGAPAIPGLRVQDGQPLPTNFASNVTGGLIGVADTPGAYTTSIRITDAAGHVLDKAVTLKISSLVFLSNYNLPAASVSSPYSFVLAAAGGTPPYTWSASGLPSWLLLDPSTGELHGVPGIAGFARPWVTVTDHSGETFTTGFYLNVNAFDIATAGELPAGRVTASYSLQLSAPGCGGSCSWSARGVPPGLSLSSGGLLSGTPTSASTFSLTVTANGNGAYVSKTFTLRVDQQLPQALAMTTNAVFGAVTIGSQVGVALSASGGTPPYTWSIDSGQLPPGAALTNSAAALSSAFAPGIGYIVGNAFQSGNYSFTLRVTDSAGASVTRGCSWVVSPLAISNKSFPLYGTTLTRGTPYTQPLLGLGGTGAYAWSGAMPAGLTLDPATGIISGTPADGGYFNVPVTVSDGTDLLTNYVSLNIGGAGPSFGSAPSLGTWWFGGGVSVNLSPYGGTPPYTISAVTPLPAGLAILQSESVLWNGTPATSFFLAGQPLAAGTFTFTLQLQDSIGQFVQRTFNVTVSPIALVTNSGLLANASLADAVAGAPYAQQFVALDAAGPVVWTASSLPAGMTITADGLLTGTPTAAGTYNISLAAVDAVSGLATTTQYTLRVAPLGIVAPGILPIAATLENYSFTFTAAGASGPVTWSASGIPTGLTLDPTTGVLSGTPAGGGAMWQMVVTAADTRGSVTRRFSLFVRTHNVFPPTLPLLQTRLPDATVGQTFTYALNPAGGLPPYSWSAPSGLPPGLSLLTDPQLPPSAFPGSTMIAGQTTTPGSYSFDLVVTDSRGVAAVRTFTLKVTNVGVVAGNLRSATAGVEYRQRVTAFGGTAPYTFELASQAGLPFQETLPPGLTLSTDGLISGTTTSTGTYSFMVRITDNAGISFSKNYQLGVFNTSGLRITTGNLADAYAGTGVAQDLFTNGGSTYAWSVVDALPPGLVLGPDPDDPTLTMVTGQPSSPGLYTYTLRATDTASNPPGSNYADRLFRLRVSPMQLVSPPVTLLLAGDLPPARAGAWYTTTLRVAGGTPPYAFAPLSSTPIPPGLTLGADGTLSGVPTQAGGVTIGFTVTDADHATYRFQSLTLFVLPAGSPNALTAVANPATMDDASVGVPYRFALTMQRGGTAPFSWTEDTALPPGLHVLAGGNGVPDYIGGIPTTPGTYTFSLTVADSTGQSVPSLPFTLNVSPLALTPDSLAPGHVGTAYSVTLAPSGGAGPYTIQLVPYWDLPPGLSLVGGTLAGTPTHAGSWLIRVLVTDSSSPANTLSKILEITIDNDGGEAAAVALTPRAIQLVYTAGSGPGAIPVGVSTTSGTPSFSATLEGIPGATLSAATGAAPASLSLDTGSLAIGNYAGVLAVRAPDAVNLGDAIPVTISVLAPVPCTYAIAPDAGSVPAAGGSGSFSLSTAAGCSWDAVASSDWITITSVSPGSGPAAIDYAVPTPNLSAAPRTGTITVGGAVYTITQFGSACSFAISPMAISAPPAGGMQPVSVTASDASCSWTASSATLGLSNTTDTSVDVTVPPNGGVTSRVLTATIAGQAFTVNQAGVNCTVTLGSTSASYSDSRQSGEVQITTPPACSYETTSWPGWVQIDRTASNALYYTVLANSSTTPRSGAIVISGQSLTITQSAAACSVTLDTSALGSPFGSGGGTGSIGVFANGSNCSWTVSSGATWISPSPGASSGNGTVTVTVGANGTTTSRSADVTIAGQSVTVSQGGQACTFSLQSSTGTVPGSGGAGSAGVITQPACGWTAASNNADWLSVSPAESSGSGDVAFVALANPDPAPRTGTLTIAGRTFTVTQPGAICTVALPVTTIAIASGGTTGASFAASTACAPAVTSYASWLTIDHVAFGGGSGSVTYSVQPNLNATTRTATIQVGDQTFTVNQIGADCGYSLHEYGAVFSRAGGANAVYGSPSALGCSPVVGTDMPSFITLGSLSGPVLDIFTLPYTVAPFDTPLTAVTRWGRITFGGQLFVVKQVSW